MSGEFDWKLVRLAAHRCEIGEVRDGKQRKQTAQVMSLERFDQGQELLEELLDGLLSAGWPKRVDISETSSCRAFPFRDSEGGQGDRELLGEMLASLSLSDFESRAQVLAQRYSGLPRAREGILLQLVVTVDCGRLRKAPFYTLFKCDFEDARQLREERGLERMDEVILVKLKKMAMYPYHDGFQLDADRMKIFQSSTSDYFHELFEVQLPATAKELFAKEVRQAVAERHQDRYDDYFVRKPPEPRELFGRECYIPVDDLLPPPEAQYVNDRSVSAAREKFDKPVRTVIKIDGLIKVEAELSGLNRHFFLARKGDQKYLIVRGERFVTKGPLSGLDFLDVENIEDILPRVMEDVTFKEDGHE